MRRVGPTVTTEGCGFSHGRGNGPEIADIKLNQKESHHEDLKVKNNNDNKKREKDGSEENRGIT